MDWNIFFEIPGYALVTNQILRLLDFKSIMVYGVYGEVSPIWKTYIDAQRIGHVSQLLSIMEKYAKISREHPYKHQMFKDSSLENCFLNGTKSIGGFCTHRISSSG